MNTPSDHAAEKIPYLCLNCGTYMRSTDQFCPNCGQKRTEHHDTSVGHMIRESFLDYFHVDSALKNSLTPLLLKPGYLTEEYLRGKRAMYVQPFKMFLVISLVYFLFGSIEMPELLNPKKSKPNNKESYLGTKSQMESPNELKFSVKDEALLLDPPDTMRKFISKFGLNVYVRYKYPDAGPVERYLLKKAIKINLSEKSFSDVLRQNASKLIFFLLPVAALLFRFLNYKKRRYYFDHLIFSIHFHTVVFLLFILFHFLAILYEVPMLIQIGVILVYLFLAMRRFYGQSYLASTGKLFLFLLMYGAIGLPLFFILLTGLSVATY
jgi:hypothetical protein